MKRALVIPFAAALAVFAAYLCYSFLFLPVGTLNCAQGDKNCIKDVEGKKLNCIPSSNIIHGRDGIVLMVNITREGDKCVRTEEVIDSETSDSEYLVGKNATCNYSLSKIGDPAVATCPGSLYEYVVPSTGGGGGGGADMPFTPTVPKIECGLEDEACKSTASGYFQSCTNSELVTTDYKWNPSGYWTLLIKVKMEDACNLYFEVLNAMNLPPGIPTSVIGSNMTCYVPISEFPIENLTSTWCTGELYDYFYP